MLSQEAFRIGLKMLEACFNVEADKTKQQIWYRLLMNVDDNDFKNAITDFCQNNTKIYPQDNIVALIIEKIGELKEKAYALKLKQEQEQQLLEFRKMAARTIERTDEETKKVLANVEKMKQRLGLHFRKPLLLEDK